MLCSCQIWECQIYNLLSWLYEHSYTSEEFVIVESFRVFAATVLALCIRQDSYVRKFADTLCIMCPPSSFVKLFMCYVMLGVVIIVLCVIIKVIEADNDLGLMFRPSKLLNSF